MNEDSLKTEARLVATEAIELSGALEYIRDGRADKALELLEMRLDVCVVALSTLSPQVESSARANLVQALRHVGSYRSRHPRQPETDLSGMDKDTVARARELQERARKVLDKIE
jgi:hypothetical protein